MLYCSNWRAEFLLRNIQGDPKRTLQHCKLKEIYFETCRVSVMPCDNVTHQIFTYSLKCGSISSHALCSISGITNSTAAVIHFRNSARLAGKGGKYTWFSRNPCKKSNGFKSGDRGGHGVGPPRRIHRSGNLKSRKSQINCWPARRILAILGMKSTLNHCCRFSFFWTKKHKCALPFWTELC